MADDRLATINENELGELLNNVDSKITKTTTHTSIRLLREYLTAKQESADFETFTKEVLDNVLGNF